MTTNVCCLNLFTGLYFIYRVVKYIFSFSLVNTYKSRLTFAFLLKFFEIQYFKWYIMVNWNFREGIWPQLDDGRSGLPPSDYYDGDGSQGPYSCKKRRLKKDWKLSLVIVPLETIRACTCARVHTHIYIYIYITNSIAHTDKVLCKDGECPQFFFLFGIRNQIHHNSLYY